jgi:SAM-dependent methyltransferase
MAVERWNHNIHYHRLIHAAIPPQAPAVLDVGCGEDMLCRALSERVPRVVGIDVDANSIALAVSAGGDVEYQCGDFLTQSFETESFDLITSVATLAPDGSTRARSPTRGSRIASCEGSTRGTARSAVPPTRPIPVLGDLAETGGHLGQARRTTLQRPAGQAGRLSRIGVPCTGPVAVGDHLRCRQTLVLRLGERWLEDLGRPVLVWLISVPVRR